MTKTSTIVTKEQPATKPQGVCEKTNILATYSDEASTSPIFFYELEKTDIFTLAAANFETKLDFTGFVLITSTRKFTDHPNWTYKELDLQGFNVMWRQVKHDLLCHQGNHCLLTTRGSVCEHWTASG